MKYRTLFWFLFTMVVCIFFLYQRKEVLAFLFWITYILQNIFEILLDIKRRLPIELADKQSDASKQ